MAAPVVVQAFLIGAPKCGTTWLADALATHSELCVSDPKEANELSDHRGTFRRLPRPIDWARYEKCFPRPGLRIDASIHAFADPDAPPRWAEWYPEARFILCIRHPVERAVSHWNMIRNSELEKRYDLSWRRFEVAWKDVRLHSESLYGRSVTRWLRHFGLDRFLILDTSELKSTPQAAFDRTTDFLKVTRRQLEPEILRPVHVTSESRPLTGVGRLFRWAAKNRPIGALKSVLAKWRIKPVDVPLLGRTSRTISCDDFHHFVCHTQVVPDLLQFAERTNFDCSAWIESTVSAAQQYEIRHGTDAR